MQYSYLDINNPKRKESYQKGSFFIGKFTIVENINFRYNYVYTTQKGVLKN